MCHLFFFFFPFSAFSLEKDLYEAYFAIANANSIVSLSLFLSFLQLEKSRVRQLENHYSDTIGNHYLVYVRSTSHHTLILCLI